MPGGVTAAGPLSPASSIGVFMSPTLGAVDTEESQTVAIEYTISNISKDEFELHMKAPGAVIAMMSEQLADLLGDHTVAAVNLYSTRTGWIRATLTRGLGGSVIDIMEMYKRDAEAKEAACAIASELLRGVLGLEKLRKNENPDWSSAWEEHIKKISRRYDNMFMYGSEMLHELYALRAKCEILRKELRTVNTPMDGTTPEGLAMLKYKEYFEQA